jgi:hypothetical protein
MSENNDQNYLQNLMGGDWRQQERRESQER